MAGVTLKCKDCGREITLETFIIKDCLNCMNIAVAMRVADVNRGWTPTRLAHWAAKHCQELGIITV